MSYGWTNAPEAVRSLALDVAEAAKEIGGSELLGVYVHGSLAMGSFQSERSDLDVIAVSGSTLGRERKRALAERLLALSGRPTALEFHLCALDRIRPWRHPCPFELHYSEDWRQPFVAALAEETRDRDAGRAEGADERPSALDRLAAFQGGDDPDLAAHFRVLRERGFALYGEPIAATIPAVPDADYNAAIRADIDVPFRDVSKKPVYYILNMLRALRFAHDGAVVSKEEAGEWGMTAVPLHIEVIADALKLYRRPEPRESLHFDVEPLQAFVSACRRRLAL